MRPAAKLDRIGGLVALALAHRDNAHLFAIFFAEQRHGAFGHRGIRRHQPCRHLAVLANAGVHLVLDPGKIVARDRRRLADIEAQTVGRVEAALLRHMRAEAAPQRLVQQVSAAMIGANGAAPRVIDLGNHRLPDLHGPRLDHARDGRTRRPSFFWVSVTAMRRPSGPRDHPSVAHLPATLGVERRLVQQHRNLGARRRHDRRGARPPPAP